jgi:hypothetical protein
VAIAFGGTLLHEGFDLRDAEPLAGVIEEITRANRKIYLTLAETLNNGHRIVLEGLLRQPTGSTSSTLAWLRQTPGAPIAKRRNCGAPD